MSKPLSEMMKSPDVGRPQATFDICVAGKLTQELEALDAQLVEIESQIEAEKERAQDRREGTRPPRRTGERSRLADLEKQAEELAERSDQVRERMEEHTVTLLLGGKTNGEWRRWASTHPARDEDDKAGQARDRRFAAGTCNIDALITDLGEYVAKYGDEDPTNGAWEFIADNAAPGDLTRMASKVVAMHEQVVDPGKSRRAWLSDRRSAGSSD